MSRPYFNHAFTIAFEAISLTDQACTAEAMIEGLKARLQELEDDLKEPDSFPGYPDERPAGTRLALIHEACGPSYDNCEITEDEMRAWKKARNVPQEVHHDNDAR